MSTLPSDISNGVNNVRNTFSSWDSCMAKSYCKWPVIAGIIIGSLILLSIIWCFASCLCCGATLCGSCARCLTCFGCCGLCGKRHGGGGSRHKDDYAKMPPTPYNGYQPQPSPMSYQPASSGPQFAQFDSSTRKIHDDSLPAMPSWDTARTRRVEDHNAPPNGFGNDVEMGQMNMTQPPVRTRGGYSQVPNGPVSPMSPSTEYGRFQNQAQPYSSDIGAQRLGQQQTGYVDVEPSPLSPAPTYRTIPPTIVASGTDRFDHGTMSPTPSEYHGHNNYAAPTRDHAWSPSPLANHDTASYQSYRRSLSPPVDHQTPNYGYSSTDQSGARPPSLLQIGRKPVIGSQREV